MNSSRRTTINLCVELVDLCLESGSMTEQTYQAIGEAAQMIQKEEYWSLRNMSKHADKNESTAKQVAISEIALPHLEKAVELWKEEDLHEMSVLLKKARDAEPKPVKKGKASGKRSSKTSNRTRD